MRSGSTKSKSVAARNCRSNRATGKHRGGRIFMAHWLEIALDRAVEQEPEQIWIDGCLVHFNEYNTWGDAMNDLLVIAFPSEQKAEEVREKLLAMQKEYLIELGDAVVAVKKPDGNIKLNQLVSTTAVGGASGAFWGALIGLIFMLPMAGAALGAASGAIAGAFTDFGINDKFMKEVAQAVPVGGAALFLLVKKMTTDKVLDDLKGVGGAVLRTSFDKSMEDAIKTALAVRA